MRAAAGAAPLSCDGDCLPNVVSKRGEPRAFLVADGGGESWIWDPAQIRRRLGFGRSAARWGRRAAGAWRLGRQRCGVASLKAARPRLAREVLVD